MREWATNNEQTRTARNQYKEMREEPKSRKTSGVLPSTCNASYVPRFHRPFRTVSSLRVCDSAETTANSGANS
jgi:hypothetical protein